MIQLSFKILDLKVAIVRMNFYVSIVSTYDSIAEFVILLQQAVT